MRPFVFLDINYTILIYIVQNKASKFLIFCMSEEPMTLEAALRYIAMVTVAIAIGMGAHLVRESKATSYLSSDAAACINCHVMESYYATWQHSSHAQRATCVECHLPVDNYIDKYASKTRDGLNHSVAFTLNAYGKRMLITDDGARRVKENCVRCHASFSKTIIKHVDRHHAFDSEALGPSSLLGIACTDGGLLCTHGQEDNGITMTNLPPSRLHVRVRGNNDTITNSLANDNAVEWIAVVEVVPFSS